MKLDLENYLTPKQQRFCLEYMKDMNATRAALAAGYSRSTAMNGRLMTMPKVLLFLQQETAERVVAASITTDMVIKELGKIAFGNIGNFFDDSGRIKPMNEVSEDEKAALWSVSVSDASSGASAEQVTKFRMYNKLSALDKLAKCMGMYKDEAAPGATYVYLKKEHMDEDDCFDDEALREEVEMEKKNQEARTRNQDEGLRGAESQEDRKTESIADDCSDLEDDSTEVICDSADNENAAGRFGNKLEEEKKRLEEHAAIFKQVLYEDKWMLPTNARILEARKGTQIFGLGKMG